MHYAAVYFLDVATDSIDRIRRKYDPTQPIIKPHIGVLFPVPESVGEENLIRHVQSVLRNWSPFTVHLRGFKKSFDHWLLLTLEEGNDDIIRLYREMYTGILARYRRHDIEFIPHIGLGLFLKEGAQYDGEHPRPMQFDEPKYRSALEEAQQGRLDFKCTVDKLNLVKIPGEVMEWLEGKKARFAEDSKVVSVRQFRL